MLKDKKVLVIDDDDSLFQLISHYFSQEGAKICTAINGPEGLKKFYACQPDLVILDLMMPDLDGWQICSRILQVAPVPIIFLTALSRDEDIIRGLEYGAVDYVTKPFNPKILVARAKSALRQSNFDSKTGPLTSYQDSYLTLDPANHRILIQGLPVKLTATEYKLLWYLVKNTERIVTFEQILESVWGWEYRDHLDYVHVYISYLRQKLEPDPKNPRYILTEYGVGYYFAKDPLE